MKKPITQSRRCGAVLIFTLLVLVVGAVVLGGLAQLMATQSLVGSREWDEAAQRITLGNSRALARQYVLSRMFRRAVPTNSFGFTNASPPAGFALSNSIADFWQPSSPVGSVAGLNINPFNPLERGGFYPASITGTLYGSTNADGSVESVPWSFQVRMRSPIAAGYAYVRHRPYNVGPLPQITSPEFYVDIDPATFAPFFFGYQGVPNMPVTSVTNFHGGDQNGFQGYFDIPDNVTALAAYPDTNVVIAGGSAQLVVNLGGSAGGASAPYVCEVPSSVSSGGSTYRVTTVVLSGSTNDPDSSPVRVLVPGANTNFTTLILSNVNTRRVYFQRERDGLPILPINVSSTANSFRLGLSFRIGADTSSDINFGGNVRLQGGLRTDAQVMGSLFLSRETNARGLDAIGDFMMWLEDHRLQ